jgi:hypothetical protein
MRRSDASNQTDGSLSTKPLKQTAAPRRYLHCPASRP